MPAAPAPGPPPAPPGGPHVGALRFLYIGVTNTDEAVARHEAVLGARLRWRFQAFGADVAAIELSPARDPAGPQPLVLLADHRPAGSVLPIYEIDDLDAAIATWHDRGATIEGPLGTPEGTAIVVQDLHGAELAFLQVERPGAMDGAWADEGNSHRVR